MIPFLSGIFIGVMVTVVCMEIYVIWREDR